MIPILTTAAGSCLTAANWEAVGVNTAAFYLTDLLIKPGFHILSQVADLSSYVHWNRISVLNASDLTVQKDGMYKLFSPYDGSLIQHSQEDVYQLIHHLKPSKVLLPKDANTRAQIWNFIAEDTFAFFSRTHMPEYTSRPFGIYWDDENHSMPKLASGSKLPSYVMGPLTRARILQLRSMGIEHLESDLIAARALEGAVYDKDTEIFIQDVQNIMSFAPIQKDCACPTCRQFTKSYLHHLFTNTPSLCHRFLIQHNIATTI